MNRAQQARTHEGTEPQRGVAASFATSRRCIRGRERGFSLTELLIAVVVLIVVIIATSKIFGTASKVTGAGQGLQSLLQEAAAIERQIRQDISRMTGEGFFVIHNVSVRNDVHWNNTTPLLDPSLPPDALLRCDQLMFFANGVQSMQTFKGGQGSRHRGQSTASRILYSPGFQLVNAVGTRQISNGQINSHDANIPPVVAGATFSWNNQIPPWFPDSLARPGIAPAAFSTSIAMTGTIFNNGASATDYNNAPAGFPATVNGVQPLSRQWTLAREQIVTADDDHSDIPNPTVLDSQKIVFLNENRALYTIFPWRSVLEAAIRKGRVDATCEHLNDIRQTVLYFSNVSPVRLNWMDTTPGTTQRGRIMRAVYYPRAEREAPSMSRVDQMLTNNVLAAGCSSFRIDWTYASGTGEATNAVGTVFPGVFTDSLADQPWFGLQDAVKGVYNYGEQAALNSPYMLGTFVQAATVQANAIETNIAPVPTGVQDYWAVFGYNQNTPLDPTTGLPWAFVPPVVLTAYTPLPTALRITMTVHDPDGKIEGGREFQFVVDLPRRVRVSQ